jgi:hypothetical protein
MNKYENLYEKGKDYLEDINQGQISLIPKSSGYISPGDVLSFTYEGGPRVFVFVVKVKRGHGVFLSGRGNLLVACFKLTTTAPQISANVLKTLYKNRRAASYANVQRGLEAIFGPNSFRTYNLSKVNGLVEILIDKQKLPTMEDEE